MKKIIVIAFSLIYLTGYSQIDVFKTDLDNQIVKHKGYTLSYNETCEQPNWVSYRVTKADLKKQKVKRTNNFKEDKRVRTGSAKLEDYYKSGYDRGHMAAAADFSHDLELMQESFLLSNVSPQVPAFNRGMWKKMEAGVRQAAMSSDTVYVVSGAILTSDLKRIGASKVCVPDFYYKVLQKKGGKLEVYFFKNEKLKGELYEYKIDIKQLYQLTGFSFKRK